jgi:hypothetical protein
MTRYSGEQVFTFARGGEPVRKSIRFAAAMAAVVSVAIHATPALAVSALSALGSGSCTQTTSGECVALSGSANAGALGSGSFSFTISISSESADNGVGGFCRIASGTGSLGGSNGTANLAEVGFLCDIGPSGGPQSFNGSFFVTSATGLIAGATGSGSVIWSVDSGGNVIVSALGSGVK